MNQYSISQEQQNGYSIQAQLIPEFKNIMCDTLWILSTLWAVIQQRRLSEINLQPDFR